jgi:NADH-quinone oxidoreductase subunit E
MATESKNDSTIKKAAESVDPGLVAPLLKSLVNKRGNLIPILQGTQSIYGYLPAVVLAEISSQTGHSLSTIYGVATFYSQFRLHPVGKYIIRICHGTACHVQNVNAVGEALQTELKISDGGTTDDSLFTLETVACLGCCSLAPVMMIGNDTFGSLTPAKAVRVIKSIRRKEGETK